MLRRLLIFFGIALALALIVWMVFALLRGTSGTEDQGSDVDNPLTSAPPGIEAPNSQLPGVGAHTSENPIPPIQQSGFTQEELDREELGQVAKNFASRFATYSNQNFARNVSELLPEATGEAQRYLDDLQNRYQALSDEYVGVSSVAAAVFLEDSGGGDVRGVRVSLRRTETRGNEDQAYNQDLELTFMRTSDGWKVRDIKWGERY